MGPPLILQRSGFPGAQCRGGRSSPGFEVCVVGGRDVSGLWARRVCDSERVRSLLSCLTGTIGHQWALGRYDA